VTIKILAAPKTIGFCLYRWFIPSDYNEESVPKINLISQPISNANVDKSHVTTLDTIPSQSKNQRDSNITLITPSYQGQTRIKNNGKAIIVKEFAN